MKKQQGFTLIELMIVVAIIAILAAIAISQYQDYVIRSQVSEGSALADGTKTAVAEFYQNKGYFPASNASAGLSAPGGISGEYVDQVDVDGNADDEGGVIAATYNGTKAHQKLRDAATDLDDGLHFSAVTNEGSIEWHCMSSGLPQKWCPSSCACSGT